MFAFANVYFLFAEQTPKWWDYPGFELWKFVNLIIFIPLAIWGMNKFLGFKGFLRARRVQIKEELEKARTERDAALAKLKEVEERLSSLNSEIETIKAKSEREAA